MGQSQNHSHDHGHDHAEHHITPFNVYVKVAAGLFALTFLTVGAKMLEKHFEPFSALIAFSIAAVKAYLVMAWFMHLKYDTKSNRIIFAMGFFFLAVLLLFSALDIFTRIYQGSIL